MENPLRRRVGVSFSKPSRTKQSMKDECDINNIMRRAMSSGMIPHSQKYAPVYQDVSNFVGYQDALNQVILATELFSSLPAKIRTRFGNDPGLYVDFCSRPENREEMIKLGIVSPPAVVVQEPAVVAGSDKAPRE